MKILKFSIILLFAAMIPLAANAQKNIKSAFEAIIKCPEAQITENHSLDRDPYTKIKDGQSDVYTFTLPASKMQLVNNAVAAFTKDSDNSYSIKQGKTGKRERPLSLAVGDGSGDGVVATKPEYEYIYALFLAPKSEDKTGNYRYAYAMNYKENGGKITGQLIITYATTLKYRQEKAQKRNNLKINNSYVKDSWFDTFLRYTTSLKKYNKTNEKMHIARRLYNHVRNVDTDSTATDMDKESAREILKVMIADPKNSDATLNAILRRSLAGIK